MAGISPKEVIDLRGVANKQYFQNRVNCVYQIWPRHYRNNYRVGQNSWHTYLPKSTSLFLRDRAIAYRVPRNTFRPHCSPNPWIDFDQRYVILKQISLRICRNFKFSKSIQNWKSYGTEISMGAIWVKWWEGFTIFFVKIVVGRIWVAK